jgi:hypothetical protein
MITMTMAVIVIIYIYIIIIYNNIIYIAMMIITLWTI